MGPLGRCHRVRKKREFRSLLANGRRARGPHFSVIMAANDVAGPRLGLAISRRAGNSPQRARLRRLFRAAFRGLRAAWPSIDLLVTCSQPWPGAGLADVVDELGPLVERAQRQPPRRRRR